MEIVWFLSTTQLVADELTGVLLQSSHLIMREGCSFVIKIMKEWNPEQTNASVALTHGFVHSVNSGVHNVDWTNMNLWLFSFSVQDKHYHIWERHKSTLPNLCRAQRKLEHAYLFIITLWLNALQSEPVFQNYSTYTRNSYLLVAARNDRDRRREKH